MKKLKLILLSIHFLILLVSCVEKEDLVPAVRRIVNRTSFDVRVEVYGDDEEFTYLIPVMDSIDIEGFCNTNAEEYCLIGWRDAIAFGNIVFQEERILDFELPKDYGKKKAINGTVSPENGYMLSKENGKKIYTFQITQEDYENAKDCDGHPRCN